MSLLSNIGFLKGDKTAGIHLNVMPDGQWMMNIMVLKKEKETIVVSEKYSDIKSVDNVKDCISTSIPIVLSVEGKGVIHRKVDASAETNPINYVFPNAKASDFYAQSGPLDNGLIMLSIIRCDTIVEIRNKFEEKGFSIYNILLGPLALNCIWRFIDVPLTEQLIDYYKIIVENNAISNLEIASSAHHDTVSVSGEMIETSLLIPYADAVSFFAGESGGLIFSDDISKESREEFLFKKAFNMAAVGVLSLILLILTINYFLFDRFNNEYVRSSLEYKSGIELVNKVNELNAELNIKSSLIEENGFSTKSRFSYYADRIAALVPQKIRLTSIYINPLLEKLKENEELDIEYNRIVITGACLSSQVLDNWMEILKREAWVRSMEIISFTQENSGTPGEFNIQIEF